MEKNFESGYIRAAYILLEQQQRPLGARELVELAMRQRLLPDNMNAKTPWKTMHARLSVHIRRHGNKSVFLRVAPGKYDIRRVVNLESYEAPPRTPPKANEQVLVFPSALLDQVGRFQGITHDWKPVFEQLMKPSVCYYMDRIQAEQNDSVKQIIAYILVTCGDRILAFKRGSYNRTADFLRGCQCVGFGGHVSSKDLSTFDADHMGIMNCAARELGEEIRLPVENTHALIGLEGVRIVGLLNDDSSENGRRHFAVIMRYEVNDNHAWATIRRKELSINQLRWLNLSTPHFSLWDFEYWSQLCLREYYPSLLDIQPSYKIVRKTPLKPPHLLCVTGQLGSGKSQATEILLREFGYTEVNSGRVLAKLLGIPPVTEATRAEFQTRAWEFIRSHEGPKQLAQAIWEEVINQDSSRVLIDGIRQRATFEQLKRLADGRTVAMLFVHTPPDVAFQFYAQRVHSVNDIHGFLKVREAPVESEVAEMIGIADAVLYNWQGKDMYHETICALINRIKR